MQLFNAGHKRRGTVACFAFFTLPALLRPLVRRYRRLLFDLLFATAADTLLTFGRDPRRLGAEIGFTLVLHTWTRDLRFHPHVHAIVTGGGLDVDADRWVSASQHYLFPVQALSCLFRGKFLAALIDLFETAAFQGAGHDPKSFRVLTRRLARQKWVVYAKKPFARLRSEASAAGRGPGQIVSYLGLYTHRVALSDSRLLSVSDASITFRTRGEGSCTITPEEFIRRLSAEALSEGGLPPSCAPPALRQDPPLRAPRPRQHQHPSRPGRRAARRTPACRRRPDPGNDRSAIDAEHDELTVDPTRPRCPHCGSRALILIGTRRTGYRRPRRNGPPPDT